MKHPLALLAGLLIMLAAGTSNTRAAVVLTAVESGGITTISGGGSLNLAGLSFFGSIINLGAEINPAGASIMMGIPGNFTADVYNFGGTSPANFGTGGLSFPNSGSGDLFGRPGNPAFFVVPLGYSSGAALSSSSTYNDTLANLGIATGTFVWTLPNDTMTLNVVPEPSRALLAFVGVAAIGFVRRRRR